MTWLYLSIASALCFSALGLFSRIVSVDSKNPRAFSLAFNLTTICMAILLFLITGAYKRIILPTQTEAWVYFLIGGFFYGMFERWRFYATKALDASIYSIMTNLSVVIAFIMSLFLYQETLTISKFLGFIFIMLSLFLIIDRKKSKISLKAIFLGLITSTLLGVANAVDKKGAIYFSPEMYNLLLWTVPFIVLYYPSININDIKREFRKFSWKIVLLSFFNFFGYYLMLRALFMAEAIKVIPIVQISTIFTVIAGIFLLNEKDQIPKKIIASVIAVLGVYLLV